MSEQFRGDRVRRGGRRPGWALLTVLLVLAIAASCALVFTSRIELLRLAVILSLWAAVVGAFVSVTYRRQSDLDQAKARDLKTVYNLQLDREIAARREYELNVEAHLRRELAHEARAQVNDEVVALRAELAALRTNLEILFDADLSHRPAIERDRGYAEWTGPAGIGPAGAGDVPARPDRVSSTRITGGDEHPDQLAEARTVGTHETADTTENPIIDVPEEPLFTGAEPVHPRHAAGAVPDVEQTRLIPPVTAAPQWMPPPATPVVPTRPNGFGPAPVSDAVVETGAEPDAGHRGRHSSAPEAEPPSRHGSGDDDVAATGGQSVAELLARLQHSGPTEGGRRRRRED